MTVRIVSSTILARILTRRRWENITIYELDPRFFLGKEIGVKQGEEVARFPTEKRVGEVHRIPVLYGSAPGLHTRILTVISPDEILVSPCQRSPRYCPHQRDQIRRVFKEGINATPITRDVFRWRP